MLEHGRFELQLGLGQIRSNEATSMAVLNIWVLEHIFTGTVSMYHKILSCIWSLSLGTYRDGQQVCPTGCFRVHGHFEAPYISGIGGLILKPFGLVEVISCSFGLVYHKPL